MIRSYLSVLLTPGWWQLLLCFLSCSALMIICLNAVEKNGFEGTLIGTLIMPYISGFPNLCFAWLMAEKKISGSVVLENCLVNNITTLTVILAIPCMLWGLNLFKGKTLANSEMKVNRLSLLMSLLALAFFGGAVFAVSRDGKINATDGMILVGIFLFWQMVHIFDVLKTRTRKEMKIKKRIWIDFFIIGICAWGIFSSTDNLVEWVSLRKTGLFSKPHLGLLSGFLMVLPNAVLCLYYAAAGRADIAYSSQIGDCHICIPLCIGIFAMDSTIIVFPAYQTAIYILMGVIGLHCFFMAFSGKLPRFAGVILTGLYVFFLYKGGL